MVGGVVTIEELYSSVSSASRTSPYIYPFTIILIYASFSYFTLAVHMRKVSCVGCIPHAWDPRAW